jgi:hypothetical protein
MASGPPRTLPAELRLSRSSASSAIAVAWGVSLCRRGKPRLLSMCTKQARHGPAPEPNLVPVSLSCSRIRQSSDGSILHEPPEVCIEIGNPLLALLSDSKVAQGISGIRLLFFDPPRIRLQPVHGQRRQAGVRYLQVTEQTTTQPPASPAAVREQRAAMSLSNR